jgi:hypothetical protein
LPNASSVDAKAELVDSVAEQWAALALWNVAQQYPNKLDHVLLGPDDLKEPQLLHPAFYGSYDWHSAVHMHWLLARLLRHYPDLSCAAAIRQRFSTHFARGAIEAECAYLQRPGSAAFERTYGWSWLLKLASELTRSAAVDTDALRWAQALEPLAQAVVTRYLDYLPRTDYPNRSGTHSNSAFGLLFALEFGRLQQPALARAVEAKALAWFLDDVRYPALYEPGGSDFLSPGLQEAVLVLSVIGESEFRTWWQGFEPEPHHLVRWLEPVHVADRTDPQTVHLDGLNLARAWCWGQIKPALLPELQDRVARAIVAHREAALPHVAQSHYVGSHWLASFALLALSE